MKGSDKRSVRSTTAGLLTVLKVTEINSPYTVTYSNKWDLIISGPGGVTTGPMFN